MCRLLPAGVATLGSSLIAIGQVLSVLCRLLPAGGGSSGKLSHCHRSSSFCFVCRLLPEGGGCSGKLSHCHRSSSFCFVQVVARGGLQLWEALSLP